MTRRHAALLAVATLVAACGSPRAHLIPPQSTALSERHAAAEDRDSRVATSLAPARPAEAKGSRRIRTHLLAPIPASRAAAWACIRRYESGGDYHNKRNPKYRGAYQFSYSSWASVGGHGDPADASPAEQDYRAELLLARQGWGAWPQTSRMCGLR